MSNCAAPISSAFAGRWNVPSPNAIARRRVLWHPPIERRGSHLPKQQRRGSAFRVPKLAGRNSLGHHPDKPQARTASQMFSTLDSGHVG